MEVYFKDIKKPKWYIILIGVLVFILQCMAAINLCAQFGGGYYTIVPIQLVVGYADVIIYLMMQKDIGLRRIAYTAIISVVAGVMVSFLIFRSVYSSVPGAKGIVYGVMMQLSIAVITYVVIRTASQLALKRRHDKKTNTRTKED